jgi:ankyrin repeat protein
MALPSRGVIGSTPSNSSSPHTTTPRSRVPRLAALIAAISRPNKSLLAATRENNPSKVREILNDQRKVVWLEDKSLSSALLNAAYQGHELIVQLLLENGANVNTTDGDSALARASQNGHQQIIWLLLEKGADINSVDRDYLLLDASQSGQEQIVRLLLEKGADANGV